MISLVIDTDVFIAALLSRNDSSVAREVIRRSLQERYQPLFGVALFTEYETLLSRDKLFADCQPNHKERETVFSALLKQAKWVEIYLHGGQTCKMKAVRRLSYRATPAA